MSVYIITTKSNQEFNVEAWLAGQGTGAYLPRVRIDKRKQREKRHNGAKSKMAVESAFGNYLFVFLQEGVDDFSAVKNAPGVIDFLRYWNGDAYYPQPVDQGIVEALKEREDEQGVYAADYDYAEGDRVRIRVGPFAGREVVLKGTSDDRIRVIVDILGKCNDVDFQYHEVEPA